MRYAWEALLIILGLGCATPNGPNTLHWQPARPVPKWPADSRFWEPSDLEKSRAVEVARWHATQKLAISETAIAPMEIEFFASFWKRASKEGGPFEGAPFVVVGFFDPQQFPRNANGRRSWPLGGFPHYFSVTVDALRWKVISHYASDE